ncbi:DNA polymerase III subunit beta [Actinokineospora auranticolor]|uniref:DNA polymerase-3 subunit beta n=1 Tax=Actinokineospora auranticolor TaxID=155976 RepID=A0A2S6GKP8_9PSEU|nr:DNA polymerase III subunit beta [Actinokineospora auranticolor]PPK65807.1 DNA polymerase-3 subunit beta [Actinokineospora auranticolor]
MDLTVTTADLAAAAADVVRLVPGRLIDPVLSGVLLTADATGVVVGASDRERTARVRRGALVHTEGRVLVPGKPLAETLRMLDQPQVRLVVEGSMLAIRAEGARFALPLLDVDLHPGLGTPAHTGVQVSGEHLSSALSTVATTASRDEALPIFTGVRIRTENERLVLRATDRYRMAIATVPCAAEAELDVMVPAALLAEVGKQLSRAGEVTLAMDANQLTLRWSDTVVTTAILDGAFLSENKLNLSGVDTTVVVHADTLLDATRRVALYSDTRGVISVEVGDTTLRLRATAQQTGEAEESIKATVTGGRTSPSYLSRYLQDALRPFGGREVRLAIQPGMRATILTHVEPQDIDLTYIVMPMLPPNH